MLTSRFAHMKSHSCSALLYKELMSLNEGVVFNVLHTLDRIQTAKDRDDSAKTERTQLITS